MTLPKQTNVEIPLLLEIARAGGSARPRAIYAKVASHFHEITEEDLAERMPNGCNLWQDRVGWVRKVLVINGDIDDSVRGIWSISQAGRDRLKAYRRSVGSESDFFPRPAEEEQQGRSATLSPLELSAIDLKGAIVSTLEGRPHHSCKLADLPKHVLKHLGKVLLGKARKEFCRGLTQAVRQLASAKVVEPYKSKNRRVRLLEDFADEFEMHKLRTASRSPSSDPHRSAHPAESGTGSLNDLLDSASAMANKVGALPELQTDTGLSEADDPAGAWVEDEGVDSDAETGRLLDVMTSHSKGPQVESLPTTQESLPAVEADVLAELETALEAMNGVQTKRRFQELLVEVSLAQEPFLATVSYDPLRHQVQVRALLPYVEEAATELLARFGQLECTGTLGTATNMGERQYIVHGAFSSIDHNATHISGAVQQVLMEAVRAAEILEAPR